MAGTLPFNGLPLTKGIAEVEEGTLMVGDKVFSVIQGAATMMAAASVSCGALGLNKPYALVAGDIGKGDGSKALYDSLKHDLPELHPTVIVMHYIKPNMRDIKAVVDTIGGCTAKSVLIADAGAMYVAKAAGIAGQFDLFTPDLGEMAFLADPDALHPAYVRNFFFEVDPIEVPKLVKQAYHCGNSSKFLLVKGQVDYIAEAGEVVAKVEQPDIPEMEAIGGTGDTLTGIVSALVYARYHIAEAATCAARINRTAGALLHPTAATQVSEMMLHIPTAIKLCTGKRTSQPEERVRRCG